MPPGRGALSGLLDVAEPDLPLHFPVRQRELVRAAGVLDDAAREPDLEHRRETGVLIDGYVIALLLTGEHVREKHHLILGQLAVSGRHAAATVFGKAKALVVAEFVLENRAILGDDA